MSKSSRKLTEAEWLIIQVVWQIEPCAAPTVQERLQKQKGWAYSTVKTLMDRMVAKGLLKTEKIRNLFLYRSLVSQTQARQGEMMAAVKRAFNGAITPMMQFLLDSHDFTAQQLNELETVIKKKRKRTARLKRT